MYQILIVDDELPALRFIHSIIKQFSTDFHVAGTASSGELALDFLQKQRVDLLITDISMHGMDGIQLSHFARKKYPDIHILVISGYSEFEYAQGAIKAGVEEYLLKPLSISKMTTALEHIREKLDNEREKSSASILSGLATGQTVSEAVLKQLYGSDYYRFAFVRWGNMNMFLPKTLGATSVLSYDTEALQILRGRDEHEQILIARDNGLEEFLSLLSSHLTSFGNIPTWTAIYTASFQNIEDLPEFIRLAIPQIYEKTVIGRRQILRSSGNCATERIRIPVAELRQIGNFISYGNTRLLKDTLQALADDWTKNRIPQRHVWHMGRQIIHQAAASSPQISTQLEDTLMDFNNMTMEAETCQDLMNSLYGLLTDSANVRTQKMSPQELYEYCSDYVRENYAHPISMQSTCDEIGISQTYLSRLFRKYSDTTFNAFLTTCRIEAAMKLLQDKPDLLLRDVATCVGYDDSSYFTKVFRQYTGKTPSQWAKGV